MQTYNELRLKASVLRMELVQVITEKVIKLGGKKIFTTNPPITPFNHFNVEIDVAIAEVRGTTLYIIDELGNEYVALAEPPHGLPLETLLEIIKHL